mmetsp:Transcript_63852/g.197692  ORF Transcript_63852/g.197692 Transcript_63852/m.197692 type:complete len:260 (-) Transcript_63852:536-1315(-)
MRVLRSCNSARRTVRSWRSPMSVCNSVMTFNMCVPQIGTRMSATTITRANFSRIGDQRPCSAVNSAITSRPLAKDCSQEKPNRIANAPVMLLVHLLATLPAQSSSCTLASTRIRPNVMKDNTRARMTDCPVDSECRMKALPPRSLATCHFEVNMKHQAKDIAQVICAMKNNRQRHSRKDANPIAKWSSPGLSSTRGLPWGLADLSFLMRYQVTTPVMHAKIRLRPNMNKMPTPDWSRKFKCPCLSYGLRGGPAMQSMIA